MIKEISAWLRNILVPSKSLGAGISIIIPFRSPRRDGQRSRNLDWLLRYWRSHLPKAEIVIGDDSNFCRPFSKSIAINNGVKASRGDILVLVDADGFVDAANILHCAKEIRKERELGRRLWFVPYRKFFRLTEEASRLLLKSDPRNPHKFELPPDTCHVQGDADPNVGHWYGAMIQIMPREAFDIVGGWDTRFLGWGGEDHAAMRAMDTLYWHHKTLPGQVLHVWHPQLGPSGAASWVHWKERMWEGQTDPSVNDRLSWRYYHAMGNQRLMRKLIDEWMEGKDEFGKKRHHHRHRLSC